MAQERGHEIWGTRVGGGGHGGASPQAVQTKVNIASLEGHL